MIINAVPTNDPRTMQVNWDKDTDETYEWVTIGAYQRSELPADGSLPDPLPAPDAQQRSGSVLSGTTTFTFLKPNTAYTFAIWGTRDDGHGEVTTLLAVSQTVSTIATPVSQGGNPEPAPIVFIRQAYAKTLHDENRIDIKWVVPPFDGAPKTYHAFNARWYPVNNPSQATQQNVNATGSDGLWTCVPLQPGVEYSIGVQGEDTFADAVYTYGPWGSITALSSQNNHSLKTFLAQSDVSGADGIRKYSRTPSLRTMMGVE